MALNVLDLHGLLTQIVLALIDEPDKLNIAIETEPQLILVVQVAQNDAGKVIGRNGRTAEAIRTFIRAAGSQMGVLVKVTFNA